MKHFTLTGVAVLLFSAGSYAQTTSTFNYTGSMQTFTVPPCVYVIHADVQGAQGGGNAGPTAGGMGGRVEADIPVTPGQVLYIFVGDTGDVTGTPGYNGGGPGYGGSTSVPGSGGGGASDIRTGGTTLNDRIIVGGGGGGGVDNGGPATGGAGGGLTGGVASPAANPWLCDITEATGGTQSAGGLGGFSSSCAWNGSNGSFGVGGASYQNYRCAGGGGGWYGGGGGHNGCGGAGGSSYAYASATSVVHTQGYRTGNGIVTLTYDPNPAPAAVNGNDSVCIGASGNYSITAMPGATSYTWSVPAGTVINSGQGTTSINVTTGSTSGNISVYATYSCGNSALTNFALNIGMYPVVYGSATDSSVCSGQMTTLTGNGAAMYSWSGGVTDGVAFTPVSSGTYTVIGTTAFGCADTAAIAITVNANPVVSLGPDVTQCGDTVCLDAGNPGSAYVWSNGDTTQMSCVTTTGTYMVHVNDMNGCDGYDTVDVTINALPNVSFMMPMTFACADDDSIAMSATPAGGTFSGTGVFGSMFSPSAAGQGYQILTYSYTDSLGCTNSDTSGIYVDLCLGIIGNNGHSIQLYPNPSNGNFSIVSGSDQDDVTIQITDAQGRVVFTQIVAMQAEVPFGIRTDNLAAGVYVLHITTGTEQFTNEISIQK